MHIFVSIRRAIGCQDRARNDQHRVGRGISKLYSLTHVAENTDTEEMLCCGRRSLNSGPVRIKVRIMASSQLRLAGFRPLSPSGG